MNKIIKNALRIINALIVTVIVVAALAALGTKLFGIKMYTVLSGSMEPEYPTGSLLFVKEIEPSELEADDVITFTLSGGTTATHRIIEVIGDEGGGLSFRTKGDANEIEDASPVKAESVIGVPAVTIPKAGFFASYISTPQGNKAVIMIGAALLLFVFVTDLLINDKKKEKDNDKA